MSNLKNNVTSVFSKVKDATLKAKDTIVDTSKKGIEFAKKKIVEVKKKNEDKQQKEIEDYKIDIDNAKKIIEQDFILEFIKKLPESPVVMNKSNAEMIKHVFPIPLEQTVIWADCEFDIRPSGIAITECGIFIKTNVTIKEEKFVKKEEQKLSELYYYRWEEFDPRDFVSEDEQTNMLMRVDEKCIRRFQTACLKEKYELDSNDKQQNEHFEHEFYRDNNTIAAGTASGAGMALGGLEAIIRNNSVNNSETGHGIMAEHANTLNDIVHLKSASVVGGDNVKNGADRIVNGIQIQCKYYKTAVKSVNAAFDNKNTGLYRYVDQETGQLMKLEVPKDQYDLAVKAFAEKITEGKVVYRDANGNTVTVTDPNEASNIVTKGKYTYEQAVNLAKPGTIESLKYDFETGTIVGLVTFSISFIMTTALSYHQTHDIKKAVIDGIVSGGKAGLLTLGSHMLISQLSRTAAFKEVMSASALRSGVITGAISFAVFSIPETYRVISKKISIAQYAVNLVNLSSSIAGGMGGAAIGASIAGAAGVGQTGLIVAGVAGGAVGGIGLGLAAGAATSIVYEGDDAKHTRLFNAITRVMVSEYLLNDDEMELFINEMNKIPQEDFKHLYDNLNTVRHQEKEIRDFLKPHFESIVSKRCVLSNDTFIKALA